MSKKTKIILIVVAIMLVVAILVYAGFLAYGIMAFFGGSNDRDNNDPKMQQEMLKTTQEWCRLAPVPDSKTNFDIKTEGSAFTRSFRCSFDLPKDDLENWIAASPGLQDATITGGDSVKWYTISPGGGAMSAEATIDFDTGHVMLYTYWS